MPDSQWQCARCGTPQDFIPDAACPQCGSLWATPPAEAITWTTDSSVVATLSLAKMNWLALMPSGIRIDMETGEVVIPEGLSLTDASRAFWEAVSRIARPGFW
jgi:hypothetical protein